MPVIGPGRFATIFIIVGLHVSSAAAFDLGISAGFHRMAVPEADSATGGLHAALIYSHVFAGGQTLAGSYRVYLDNDEDDLDPDHVPVWMENRHRFEAELHRWSASTHLAWAVDLYHKRNTVSSVEWQVRAFPALALHFQDDGWQSAFYAGAGYYALEIDDDVPSDRGYVRADLRNQTTAVWLRADGTSRIARSLELGGRVEYWADQDTSLEFVFGLGLSIDTAGWIENSRIVIEGERTRYGLDPYDPSGPEASPVASLPVLPWDHDVLLRVAFELIW